MVVFRCTQRVVGRFKVPILEKAPASTGVLGDWYINLMNVGPTRLVLCQSARSLLPVILPARKEAFPGQFGFALGMVLRELGVRREQIEQEQAAVREVVFARTASRQMLGAMNDFAYNGTYYLLDDPGTEGIVLRTCLKLASMPSKPLGYDSADRVTLALFQAGRIC